LVVDENITLADLKGTLLTLARKMFGEERQIRLRPSYFPFTEPSVEVDVSCYKCNGKGCPMCKHTGWIEILGAGMVNWEAALQGARLFHASGINFGLATHSGYERNFNLEAFEEALEAKPEQCRVGMDFNYRGTLWSIEQCKQVMTPIIVKHVDWFITTIEDMAKLILKHKPTILIETGEIEKVLSFLPSYKIIDQLNNDFLICPKD